MFEILAVIAVVLAAAIVIILILAMTKPKTLRVQRAAAVKSPPENKDPAMTRSYGGAASGRGAVYAWDGNKNVGSGRMEILEASSPSKIVIKLDFLKPFEAHNTAEFTMLPQGD